MTENATYCDKHISSQKCFFVVMDDTEASSFLTSKRKPFTVLKPICLNIMATEKSAQKGGRQHRGNTTLDLPADLYELYKSDPEESYTQRKNRIQWVRRYWAE